MKQLINTLKKPQSQTNIEKILWSHFGDFFFNLNKMREHQKKHSATGNYDSYKAMKRYEIKVDNALKRIENQRPKGENQSLKMAF